MIPKATPDPFDQSVSNDIRKEQLCSVTAAISAVTLTVALLCAFTFNHAQFGWLVDVFVLLLLLPSYAALLSLKLLDRGQIFLCEMVCYLGIIWGIPWLIVIPFIPGTLVFLLSSLYGYQGRLGLAAKFGKIADRMLQRSGTLRQLNQAGLMEIVFHGGDYDEATEMGKQLVRETDEKYKTHPTDENLRTLCIVQSSVVALLSLIGRRDEAQEIWTKMNDLRGPLDSGSTSNATVYSYLAYGAGHLKHFNDALRYSELAHQCAQREHSGKTLAGCISEHWALACLGLGRLDDSEQHAKNAHRYWGTFLSDTAERMADSYYALGCVELGRSHYVEAHDLLSRAVAIRRRRNGKLHPELALVLSAYSQCMRKLGKDQEAEQSDTEIASIQSAHHTKPN